MMPQVGQEWKHSFLHGVFAKVTEIDPLAGKVTFANCHNNTHIYANEQVLTMGIADFRRYYVEL